MKLKKKILIAVMIFLTIFTMNGIILFNSVKAVNLMELSSIDLHYGGMCEQLLKYKGVIVKTTYVEYYGTDGKNYPAYCLDKSLPGVTEEFEYAVSVNKKLDDIGLWRTVINGYPYKSISELGVASVDEAFTATKQAIYCYLFENTPDDYEGIGEAGERTLNALKNIVSNAEKSTETQIANTFKTKAESEEWSEDKNNKNYIYKVYSLDSAGSYLDYDVSIEGKLPEGSKVTKLDGTETKKFSQGEKFKIMLLKEKLNSDGQFKINIKTEIKTNAVLYGGAPDETVQNYALTAYMYEDSNSTYTDKYKKIEKPKEQEQPEQPKQPEQSKEEKPTEEVKILPVTGM